jgi:hypothetical protein
LKQSISTGPTAKLSVFCNDGITPIKRTTQYSSEFKKGIYMLRKKLLINFIAVLLLAGCASGLATTGVDSIHFGMSPQSVLEHIPKTETIIESSNAKIVSEGPSNKGDMRRKTFTFKSDRLSCVKHQFINPDGTLRNTEINFCE